MIDPVIFSIQLGTFTFALRWYGVFVMSGIVFGGWIANREIVKKGGNPEALWDAMIWFLPAAIIGARLWYVINATIGGSNYYLDHPGQILNTTQGGLHFYGGLIFGALVLFVYLKRHKMDFWLFLDAIAPAALLGQAFARPANYINQELYGGPTNLPWGIPIDAVHRLPMYSDLTRYPVETTRFHPTFAYEMIWNILAFFAIYALIRKWKDFDKPGTAFSLWLIFAGFGRAFIEFFRPDQPLVYGDWMTTSMLVAFLMGLAGVVMLMIRQGWIKQRLIRFPDKYKV